MALPPPPPSPHPRTLTSCHNEDGIKMMSIRMCFSPLGEPNLYPTALHHRPINRTYFRNDPNCKLNHREKVAARPFLGPGSRQLGFPELDSWECGYLEVSSMSYPATRWPLLLAFSTRTLASLNLVFTRVVLTINFYVPVRCIRAVIF